MIDKKDLELKKELNSRKPKKFLRQNSGIKRLSNKWRKPKGIHSKLRRSKKGHPKLVKVGYGKPKRLKNIHPQGFKQIHIYNLKDLEKISPEKEGVIIDRTVGQKRKVEIIKEAQKKGITILNFKNPLTYIDKVKKKFEERRKKKQQKEKEKEEKKKKAKEKIKEKDKKEKQKEKQKEEKRKQEKESGPEEKSGKEKLEEKKADGLKKEKDKVLTKKK